MDFIKAIRPGNDTVQNGAACGSGIVCPSASGADCNQSGEKYSGFPATLTSDTQVNNGGPYSKKS